MKPEVSQNSLQVGHPHTGLGVPFVAIRMALDVLHIFLDVVESDDARTAKLDAFNATAEVGELDKMLTPRGRHIRIAGNNLHLDSTLRTGTTDAIV